MFGVTLLVPRGMVSVMTGPSDVLREEHEVIEHLLHVLAAMANRVDHGEVVAAADIRDALEVVVNFADKCHHAKEEKALFPALVRASPVEGSSLVQRLERDHQAGRRLVAALRSDTDALLSGGAKARASFARDARSYVALLTEHIDQETAKLLPLIDRALSAKERDAMAAEFDRIEREETGAGIHEKYEGTIHRLADTYVHGTPEAH